MSARITLSLFAAVTVLAGCSGVQPAATPVAGAGRTEARLFNYVQAQARDGVLEFSYRTRTPVFDTPVLDTAREVTIKTRSGSLKARIEVDPRDRKTLYFSPSLMEYRVIGECELEPAFAVASKLNFASGAKVTYQKPARKGEAGSFELRLDVADWNALKPYQP